MKSGTGKKRQRYQRILRKLPPLYEISELVYADYMKHEKKATSEDEAWAVAFSYVLAPTMLLYVLWVLTEALKSGKRRLYFLARDGYMMYLTAKCICESWNIPIECRYLYCSRYALRSGEYKLLGKKSLDYICLGGMNVTFEAIMHRGGLSEAEAIEVGSSMNMQKYMKQKLTYRQVRALRGELEGNSLFMKYVMEHSAKAYPNVVGYFAQEGMFDSVSYAIVDSGWVGSIQKSINQLLQSAGLEKKIEGYYFGLYEYAENMDAKLYHSYYFAAEGYHRRKALFCNNLFECVFSSPEGMTREYCFKNQKYVPCLSQKQNPNLGRIEKGAGLVVKYAETYAEYQKFGQHDNKGKQLERHVLELLLTEFMGHPSEEEAKVFGGYVFNDDVIGEEKKPLAAVLSHEELRQTGLMHRLLQYVTKQEEAKVLSAWPEGSSVLSDGMHTNRLTQDALYKYLLYCRKSMERKKQENRRCKSEKRK